MHDLPRQHQPPGHAARGGARLAEQDADLRALPRRQAAAGQLQHLPRGRRAGRGDQRPHRRARHPGQCQGATRRKTFCADCHNGLEMPHPTRWNAQHGPHRRRPRQEHLRVVPPQEGPQVLHRLPRPADAASRAAGERPRHLRAQSNEPRSASSATARTAASTCHGLQMPHPGRLDVAAPEHGALVARRSAPSATAARSASAATASSCRTAAPSSPTTRTTCTAGQRVHEVPRQRRHGPARLLRWPVPLPAPSTRPRPAPPPGSVRP